MFNKADYFLLIANCYFRFTFLLAVVRLNIWFVFILHELYFTGDYMNICLHYRILQNIFLCILLLNYFLIDLDQY